MVTTALLFAPVPAASARPTRPDGIGWRVSMLRWFRPRDRRATRHGWDQEGLHHALREPPGESGDSALRPQPAAGLWR